MRSGAARERGRRARGGLRGGTAQERGRRGKERFAERDCAGEGRTIELAEIKIRCIMPIAKLFFFI